MIIHIFHSTFPIELSTALEIISSLKKSVFCIFEQQGMLFCILQCFKYTVDTEETFIK